MPTVISLLLLVIAVNALPFLAHLALNERLAWPIDFGRVAKDGERILGDHKTFRGVIASIVGGSLLAPMLGLAWWLGAIMGLLAMIGDLTSSFVKRRWHDKSGTPRFGFDQLLESLLPAIFAGVVLSLSWLEMTLIIALFTPIGYGGSRYLHYLLYRPSISNYPRFIRSTTRFREWRACHPPMARWQRWLNFENYVFYRVLIEWTFRTLGLYQRGVNNVLNVAVVPLTLTLEGLPKSFDGWRVLLLTDLHLDGLEGLTDAIIKQVEAQDVDLCIFGGDLRMEVYGPIAPALREVRRLVSAVQARSGVFGILGNHDCIEMLPDLEQAGISMLVNESKEISHNGESLWLVGIDDPHYYRCHDLNYAFRNVPTDAFSIFLSHTPEVYREAAEYEAGLYLCGHTHGGQICLPYIGPVFTHCSAPRRLAAGHWEYRGMPGYTSRGAGASGVPVRFNCPGEIALITLRCKK